MKNENENKVPAGQVIGRDVAESELNRWFDMLEVPEEDRIIFDEDEGEKPKNDIMREKAIKAIMSGRLIVNEENTLEYTLKTPLKKENSGEVVLSKLTFKLRYREHELEGNMRGVNPDHFLAMTRAYVATVTGTSKSLLGKLWNVDSAILQSIYTLFTRGDA